MLIKVNPTGHRKATSYRCNRCGEWHDTHRGLNPGVCPLEETAVVSRAPAVLPEGRLGSKPRQGKEIVLRLDGPSAGKG